jgi:iron complex transport system substrate-binding protein
METKNSPLLHKIFYPGILAISVFILIFAFPAFAQDGEWTRTLVDGLGNEVTIAAPPERIASVSLVSDEVLLSLIEPERIAAVTALALDPAISNVAVQAQDIPNTIVASEDTEFIISLEPDIVFVASFTTPEVVQQLKDAGLTVFATGYPIGFQQIKDNITLLGQAVGAEARAAELVAWMDSEIANVSGIVARDNIVSALYLTPGNYTSGVDSSISEVIAAANGIDVAAQAGIEQFAPVTDEFIIEQNPDVILLSGWTPWDATFVDTFKNNPAFADLSAVQNDRLYVANDAHLTTVSQYIVEGVKDVAAYLWPEAYPAFPVTVTDAAGSEITIEERPEGAVVIAETNNGLLAELMPYLGAAGVTITFTDALALPEGQVIFSTDANLDANEVVVLYDGDTPAEVVANIALAGDALGERVAALNAIAVYTDGLEAQAAG